MTHLRSQGLLHGEAYGLVQHALRLVSTVCSFRPDLARPAIAATTKAFPHPITKKPVDTLCLQLTWPDKGTLEIRASGVAYLVGRETVTFEEAILATLLH